MPPQQYQRIVQMSAEQLKLKDARPPPELESLLAAAGIEPSTWLGVVEHFGHWFHRAAGHAERIGHLVARQGKQWIHGIQACRNVFT